MRILWLGNPPMVGSGYGEQAATFLPRLQALGHDMAVFANYGVNEHISQWHGIPVFPSDAHYGNKAIGTWAEVHQADLIIALCDAFVLTPNDWPDGLPPVAVWAPVDHYPIPPAVVAQLSHERIRPIAMSRFGETMMQGCDLDPLYIPHGIDTSLFRPQPELRDSVRDMFGIPQDAFLAGMVAANKSTVPSRKSFPQAFHAFSQFAKQHDDAWLYVHSQRNGMAGHGIDLELLACAVGLDENRVRFPEQKVWDRGMSNATIAKIYQAFDVLLMPSMGEGFGIPLVEAQACGVPVIASDHSAMTELTHAGWLVTGDPWWDAASAAFFIVPSIASIHAALAQAYEHREDQGLRDAAAAFGATYDADLVTVDYWMPALERLAPKPVSRQVRRAEERRKAKVAA